MGGGRGPNSGGGRRSGGGGHQAGQGEMAQRKVKAAKAREERSRAKASARGGDRDGGGGRGSRGGGGGRGSHGGRGGGRGAGRGSGAADHAEQVVMTASNQQLVSGLLAKAAAGAGSSRAGSSGDLPAVEARVDVDPEDVERKSWQALEKKGFKPEAIGTALAATAHLVAEEADRREAFNEQRRRRVHRGLDWLILNVDEKDLPETFREEAKAQRSKRGGKKNNANKRRDGTTSRNPSGEDAADGVDPATAALATTLRRAGFPADVALASAAASDGDQWGALMDLCAALGPDRAEALEAAAAALEEAGAGSGMDAAAIGDILRQAQRDELASLPRAKHAPRGFAPAQLRATLAFDQPGIVQLGAKQYQAKLEVSLEGRDAYPFELPRMKFTHPTLRFEEAAAVNAAAHRFAAELVGEPFLERVLEWCEGEDVADAVESAREKAREESEEGPNGEPRSGDASRPELASHLSRTFGKLELRRREEEAEEERNAERARQLMEINAREAAGLPPAPRAVPESNAATDDAKAGEGPNGARRAGAGDEETAALSKETAALSRPSAHAPSAEARAAATARRRALAAEQAALNATREAEAEAREATDAADRVARAAAAVAASEARAATDPRVAAESERMRAESERRASGASAEARKMAAQRERLPSWSRRGDLLDAIARSQVTIVAGETGCGKTTQLPQFILDDAIQRGEGARTNLICTQPRRISATSVASRVAAERGESVGRSVGYKIRLESVSSSATRILFVTTGVLLRRLSEDPLLAGVSHVVVDEVHERSLDSDFLLVLLRDVLPHRPTLRVVLMSATLDAAAFSEYFAGAEVRHIPGFTFPVQEHYLEDILQVTSYRPGAGSEYCKKGGGGSRDRGPGARDAGEAALDAATEERFLQDLRRRGYVDATLDALRVLDQSVINYELIAALIKHVCVNMDPGAILVFMPGLAEITRLHEACANDPAIYDATGRGAYLIGLHSTLSSAEQRVIFEHPPGARRKIVIATNIAETSITIDDVVYVIDAGKCKENGYDPSTRMQLLLERWVSRASAKQRRGRAGRVAAGRCFRTYTRLTHDRVFAEHTLPEIKRVPLEGLCLQIQLQRMAGGIAGFLGKALEPPKEDAVTSAIKTLKQIGALDEKERLTSLGSHLAALPVDVRVGKMLLYGAVLGCLAPVLTIAAVLGGRSPFVAPLEKRDEADAAKRAFAEDQSDHLATLNAFDAWTDAKKLGKAAEMAFTRENFLSFRALEGVADLRNQFAQLLQEAGFLGGGSAGKKRGSGRDKITAIPAPRSGTAPGAAPTPSVTTPAPPPPDNGRSTHKAGGRSWGRRGPPPDDPVWASANRNASNTRLVKAVLVAGLYPNLIKCAPPSRPTMPPRLTYLGEDGREAPVQVHPSSVNHGAKKYAARWMVYHERVQTTSVFVRDCSTVTPYQLLLFGGKIAVQHAAGTLSLDNEWAKFKAPARVGVLLKEIRARLDRVLSDKIERPDEDVQATGGPLVEAILQLLNTEPLTAAPSGS
jgi:ATP-dependent RNA helicase DHX57